MYHIFLIHSSINGSLCCFHVLTILYSTSMNIEVHVSFQIMFFSEYMPRSGTTESYGSSLCWEDPLEEGTAIHSSTLAWRESHGERSLEGCSLESHRVRHNWNNLACTHTDGSYNFRFLRTFHTVLHSVPTSSHIRLQCRRFSFSPPPLQHLLLWIFWC